MIERSPVPDPEAPRHGDLEGARLAVLRLLEQRPDCSQRDLSQALGLSLGKTHYVLHALLDKGLVKARNFRRSDRKLAYAYVAILFVLGCAAGTSKLSEKSEKELASGDAWRAWQLATRGLDKEPGNPRARAALER